MIENMYCWQTNNFSAYGLLAPEDSDIERPKVKLTGLLKPAGEHKLLLKGTFQATYPFEPELQPQLGGMRVFLEDSDGALITDLTIPAGLYDPLTREGWKVLPPSLDAENPPRSFKFLFKSRDNEDGIRKVLVKVKLARSGDSADISVLVKGADMDLAVDADKLPVQMSVDFSPQVFSGLRFATTLEADACLLKNGATLLCR